MFDAEVLPRHPPPAMSAPAIRKKLESIATQWPKDALRPKLQFGQAISTANQRIFASQLSADQAKKAEAMSESLTRLLHNAASREFPMSERTLRPASFPNHYEKLKDGIARIERGETSSSGWLGRLFGRR